MPPPKPSRSRPFLVFGRRSTFQSSAPVVALWAETVALASITNTLPSAMIGGALTSARGALHRLLGRAARQRPVGLGLRRRQEEVLALQAVGHLELLAQLQQRDS